MMCILKSNDILIRLFKKLYIYYCSLCEKGNKYVIVRLGKYHFKNVFPVFNIKLQYKIYIFFFISNKNK